MNDLSPDLRPTGSIRRCDCASVSGVTRRFGPTHALVLLITIFALGCGLFLAETPLTTIFALLSGCGGIGAATLIVARGGRHLVTAVGETLVRSSIDKQ